MNRLITAFVGAFFLIMGNAYAGEYKLGDLVIVHPYVRSTPPGAPVSGGYMTIRNTGSEPDHLVAGSADFAGKVEMHLMVMDGDVMKMRPVPGGIEIPAHGEVTLKPGGYHVMFMQLKEQMQAGEKRKTVLQFEKAGTIEVEFDVQDIKPGGTMDHGSMDHSSMDHGTMNHSGHGG